MADKNRVSGKAKPVESDYFERVMQKFSDTLIHARMDTFALQQCLIKAGVISQQEVIEARRAIQAEMKTTLDSLAKASPERLAEILRGTKDKLQ